jgi:hypothetical protein
MYGAYPTVPDRPGYAHDTNLKQLIEEQKPLVHDRGDPSAPTLSAAIEASEMHPTMIAPFVTPEPLQDYDVIVHPISGAQSMGDPIDRDPAAVEDDLNKGWVRPRVAEEVHGVVISKAEGDDFEVDVAATEKKREAIRAERKRRAVPFKEWWAAEKEKVAAREGMDPAVCTMWRTSMELSPEYGDELRRFWGLPGDFTF